MTSHRKPAWRWTSRASVSPCRSSGRSIDARPAARVESLLDPDADDEADVTALFSQTFVDQARLADNIRAAVPERGSALLDDIVRVYPVEQGAAEIVGYLALAADDLEVDRG